MKPEIDILNERIAEGKRLLLDQMRMTNERTEEILRLRDVVNSLTEALQAALADTKPISRRTDMRQGHGCTEIVEITEWPEWMDDARAALTAAGVA